jgi:hypothetical protein
LVALPAKDHYHDLVKRALIKEGWTVDGEQVVFLGSERHIVIDLQISKQGAGIILVEIKTFYPSMLEALANAVGKMLIYRYILAELAISIPVWLAVPEFAYQGILTESVGITMRQQLGIDLVVFSIESEEIIEWIPYEQS